MTEKELQDLIGLKKYEQPEDGYFEDFLVEFQQRQRSEMLKTSARGLLIERAKAWFSEFGALRWVMGAGAAYAAFALVFYVLPDQSTAEPAVISTTFENDNKSAAVIPADSIKTEDAGEVLTVSMAYTEPVDFSAPAPAFFADERIF